MISQKIFYDRKSFYVETNGALIRIEENLFEEVEVDV
jgi:hypothetical protein